MTEPGIETVVLHAAGQLRVEQRQARQLAPHQVRIDVMAVGVCGSDTHYFTHGRIGEFVLEAPIVLGHEPAGIVTEVGSAVEGLRVGSRVSIEPGIACGLCANCKAGHYNLCPEMHFMATPPHDGCFATEIVWDTHFCHELPDELDFEQGALCEPLSVGLWACARSNVAVGDEVLVSGAGPVGLLAAEVARARGASRVVVSDVAEGRLDLVRSHGHEARLVTPAGEPRLLAGDGDAEFSVLLECSGAPGALADGLKSLRRGGRAVMIGIPTDDPQLPLGALHHRELQVSTIFRYCNTWPTALELLRTGRVDTMGLVTHRFDLAHVEDALMASSRLPGCVKAMVLPQGL